MERNMKFKELKKYMSICERVSVCILDENLTYKNYKWLRDVPDIYDEMYVIGIGRISSEFSEDDVEIYELEGSYIGKGRYYVNCIEIILSEKPTKELNEECNMSELLYVWTRYPVKGKEGSVNEQKNF